MGKLIVVEANEIPLRIFRHYAARRPMSTVARLLAESCVAETLATDVPVEKLYPSQTWASFNTGAPFERHGIHWYNDPKPAEYPFYWQVVADQGRRVGLVNSLHTSPAARFADSPRIRFLVPDCFAEDARTKPDRYDAFQRVNLKQTKSNRRVVNRFPVGVDEVRFLTSLPGIGIRLRTLGRIASVVGDVALRHANRERIRNLQFLLVRDIFWNCLRRYEVDLAVVFTNHVAANLHRYWYALFPGEYERPLFGPEWIRKYEGEIVHSLDLLDEFLADVVRYVRRNDCTLALVTSMGQCAHRELEAAPSDHLLVKTPETFFRRMLSFDGFQMLTGMEPQYSLRFEGTARAEEARECLARRSQAGLRMVVDRKDNVVTVTLRSENPRDSYEIDGKTVSLDELGMTRFKVDDCHTGRHDPRGTLMVFNSRTTAGPAGAVDFLEFAPAVCEFFGITPPTSMKRPGFRI